MSRVVIVGGGISGLAAAWELQARGVDYTLLEASERLGGKIVTERADGFIVEGGADSFLTHKPWAWQLCHEIGLGDRLIGTNDARRNVYVWRGGQLHLMPRGLRLIAPLDAEGLMESTLLSDAGKHRMLDEAIIPPRADGGDESLATFVRRRFGDEALEVFGEPLLAGIHVGDPETLSMRATFPNLLSLEQSHGSVTAGMRQAAAPPASPGAPATAFVSLRGGMGELIDGLRARLTGDLRLGQAVTGIDADRTVHTASGERLAAEAIILTTPAHAIGRLVRQVAPELAEALATIRTASSGTVSLGYRADEVAHPLDGFGFVIPRREPTRLLACTWSSSKLAGRAPAGHVLMRVFVGGHAHPADVVLPDDQLVELARSELKQIMGIDAAPVLSRVFRWRDANPQYEVGHLERVARFQALCPPWLFLAGCTYSGVGIPDCVRQARATAGQVAAAL
jgi:oxygen-dependent protoporphyrinogen oxidase